MTQSGGVCTSCGGLICLPGVVYGYVGKVCQCPERSPFHLKLVSPLASYSDAELKEEFIIRLKLGLITIEDLEDFKADRERLTHPFED